MKRLLHTVSLAFGLSSAATLGAAPVVSLYAPPSHPKVLTTTYVDWDSLAARKTSAGESRPVFDNPTPTLEKLEVHVTTLLPGKESHPVHQHAWEEMLLIKEGNVEVSINGVIHPAGPGALVFFASHDPHNLKNVGTTPATYYVINYYTDLVHTTPDKPAHEQAIPGKLASTVIDCNAMKMQPTKTGARLSLLDSPTLTFVSLGSHITSLNPGQSSAPDIIDAGEELFFIKSGTVEVSVDGVAARMQAGSFLYCIPNAKRTFRNIGTVPASYHVIRVASARTPALAKP